MKFGICFLVALAWSSYIFSQVKNIKAGNWKDNSIWSTGKAPSSSDDVSLQYDISVNVDAYCRSLTSNGYNIQIQTGYNLYIIGNYTSSLLLGSWRLYANRSFSDTSSIEPWYRESYQRNYYSPNDYYCFYSPYSNKTELSPYKCSHWINYTLYFLPDEYCDRNREPVLSDTPYFHLKANDLIFNTNSAFSQFYHKENSKSFALSLSSCSNFVYSPATKDSIVDNGTWNFTGTNNILTIQYDLPNARIETYKVWLLTDKDLVISPCSTCSSFSGLFKWYKKA